MEKPVTYQFLLLKSVVICYVITFLKLLIVLCQRNVSRCIQKNLYNSNLQKKWLYSLGILIITDHQCSFYTSNF